VLSQILKFRGLAAGHLPNPMRPQIRPTSGYV